MNPLKKILPLFAAVLIPVTAVCSNAESFMKQATVKEEKGDIDGALDDFELAYSNYISDIKYETDSDNAAAEKAKADALNEKIAGMRRERGLALEKKGDFSNAASNFYQAMERKRDYAPNYYDCARMDYKQGDLVHALCYSTRAIELKPDYADAYVLRGSVKLMAVRLRNALHDGRVGAVSIELAMSKDFVKVKIVDVNLAGALADLEKAIALKPDFAEAYDCRGLVKYYKGDMDGAIVDFTKAIAERPQFAFAYDNRAHARLAGGDWKAALADFDKAVEIKPDFAAAYGSRAAAKQAGGDMEGALTDLDKAVGIKADYFSAFDLRGLLRMVKGDPAGAVADFRKVAELEDKYFISQGNWNTHYNDPTFVTQAAGDMDGALAGMEDSPTAPAKDAKLRAAFAMAYYQRAAAASGAVPRRSMLADLDKAIALKPDFDDARRARDIAKQPGDGHMNNFFDRSELCLLSYVTPEPAIPGGR